MSKYKLTSKYRSTGAQPEAYLPASATYIEKDLAINEEIDRLRLRAVSSLLSGRKDVYRG